MFSAGGACCGRAWFWHCAGHASPFALASEVRDECGGNGCGYPERDVDDQRRVIPSCHFEDHPTEYGSKPEAEVHEGEERSEDEAEMLRAVTIGGDGGRERGRCRPGDAEDESVDVEQIPG